MARLVCCRPHEKQQIRANEDDNDEQQTRNQRMSMHEGPTGHMSPSMFGQGVPSKRSVIEIRRQAVSAV
jgi:hypothetical protein